MTDAIRLCCLCREPGIFIVDDELLCREHSVQAVRTRKTARLLSSPVTETETSRLELDGLPVSQFTDEEKTPTADAWSPELQASLDEGSGDDEGTWERQK